MAFESKEMSDEIRNKQLEKSIKLSDGTTYYELGGPENGEVVVLVHGLTTPFFVWDPTFEMLTQKGFRVLRYDLFGRGYSDRPKAKYDDDFYDKQLIELITSLNLTDKKINIAGISLGGAICANFALRHKDLVNKICLIDPAYPSGITKAFKVLKIPGLKNILMKLFGEKMVVAGVSKNFYRLEDFPDYEPKFKEQMQYKGYLNAVVSTGVNYNLGGLHEVYIELEKLDIPTQLFWGENDVVVPYTYNENIREVIPNIKFHSIEKAGHLSHYERPDLVNPLLFEFLKNKI
ncbi:MAG: alpha/beta hydrolase [archaeon]|nr:alpha/beta hydrolase [archaeon]